MTEALLFHALDERLLRGHQGSVRGGAVSTEPEFFGRAVHIPLEAVEHDDPAARSRESVQTTEQTVGRGQQGEDVVQHNEVEVGVFRGQTHRIAHAEVQRRRGRGGVRGGGQHEGVGRGGVACAAQCEDTLQSTKPWARRRLNAITDIHIEVIGCLPHVSSGSGARSARDAGRGPCR